jgi:hypothetical protein
MRHAPFAPRVRWLSRGLPSFEVWRLGRARYHLGNWRYFDTQPSQTNPVRIRPWSLCGKLVCAAHLPHPLWHATDILVPICLLLGVITAVVQATNCKLVSSASGRFALFTTRRTTSFSRTIPVQPGTRPLVKTALKKNTPYTPA